jgi:hypothetical protein
MAKQLQPGVVRSLEHERRGLRAAWNPKLPMKVRKAGLRLARAARRTLDVAAKLQAKRTLKYED